MLAEVFLDLLPIISIVADAFAVRANREQALKRPDFSQSRFEFLDALAQFGLQGQHPFTHLHARSQHLAVEGFGYVVVGAGPQPFDNVLTVALGRQNDQIDGERRLGGAEPAADFHAVETRHHPVEDGEAGRVVCRQLLESRRSVLGLPQFVPPSREKRFEDSSGDRIVVYDKDFHICTVTWTRLLRPAFE